MNPSTHGLLALVVTAPLVAACATSGRQVVASGEELPVARAVLYQNGVGYFERRGRVEGDRVVLRVRPDQIGDLLKSLTVVDFSGGSAVSVALPVEKTRSRALADLPEQVRNAGGMVAIAAAFRGARVQVETDDDEAEGRLLGVEASGVQPLGDDDDERPARAGFRLSVLTDGGSIRAFPVEQVVKLKIHDRALELGLRKSLDVALGEASWRPVELVVRLEGGKRHDLAVTYVVEMPAWKPAYRVVLGAEQKALLQGWAVVDNLSGQDWRDVRLSLAAGTPLAFRYDLYTPRYRRRPDLTPPEEEATAAVPPPIDVEGPAAAQAMPSPAPSPPPGMAGGGRGRPMAPRADRAPQAAKRKAMALGADEDGAAAPEAEEMREITTEALERSFHTLVSGAAVGSLYRYDIGAPVTVRDRESALVSILNARVSGDEVLLFRVGEDRDHPYRAARLANETGSVIERGPVAIYREGTFLGEALSGRVEKGATTFVPFAIDGRVRVDLSEQTAEEGVRLIKIVGGVLTAETKYVTTFSYDVTNASGEAATLWVARPKRTGWKLVGQDPAKVREQSGRYYLPIALAATGRTKVDVREETPTRRQVEVASDLGKRLLGIYVTRPDADPRIAAALREVITRLDRISAIEDRTASLTAQKETYAQREEEVRENIKALAKGTHSADLRRTLDQSLAELEKKLEEVSREIVTLSIERQKLRDELAVRLRAVTLEEPR